MHIVSLVHAVRARGGSISIVRIILNKVKVYIGLASELGNVYRQVNFAVAKLSIATGHGMQIYNCFNCPRQLQMCIACPVAMLSFATVYLDCSVSFGYFSSRK